MRGVPTLRGVGFDTRYCLSGWEGKSHWGRCCVTGKLTSVLGGEWCEVVLRAGCFDSEYLSQKKKKRKNSWLHHKEMFPSEVEDHFARLHDP